MKKLGSFAIIGLAAAGILGLGSGIAAAQDQATLAPIVAPGEPNPSGTGSSATLIEALTKALSSGSGGTATPAP